ncbi:MAG: STT3 domain-containing protein [Myxococcota bacterium]
MTDGPEPPRSGSALAATALFLAALAVRALPWRHVFDADRVVFAGNDAWYHVRRAMFALAHFPAHVDVDPFLAWPDGSRAIWPPAFDALVAAAAAPAWALAGLRGAETAAAWVPPVLGALGVVALHAAVRALDGARAALVAGALACVLGGLTWYAQVGFVDHHVAVSALAAAMLGAAVRVALDDSLAHVAALSALEALALVTWPGALLHVALVELGLLAGRLVGPRDAQPVESARWLRRRALGHALAAALVAPFCTAAPPEPWSAWSATVLSHFQPWAFAAAAAHAALASAVFARTAEGARGARTAAAAGIALAVAGASAVVFPELLRAGGEAWQWLARAEDFQHVVAESEPLFERRGALALAPALARLSALGLLLPALVAAYARDARARRDAPARAVVLVFAVGAALAAVAQKRFAGEAALAVAWLAGWAAVRAADALAPALGRGRARAAVGAALLALAAPALAPHARAAREAFDAAAPLPAPQQSRRNLLAAADWLRAEAGIAPDAPPSLDAPGFGVLAPWEHGHALLYAAALPVVASNFGDDVGPRGFALHREYFRSAEPRAVRLLDRLRARFVVVESLTSDDRERLGPRTMLRRLAEPALVGLAHHRLRFATPARAARAGVASYRVFERVAGATIEGSAPPGESVEATLVATPGATRVVARARADASGRFAIAVAQASDDAGGAAWQLRAGALEGRVVVAARAVREGGRVEAPPLAVARRDAQP